MARWHSTDFDFLPERAFQPRAGGMTLEGGSSTPAPDPRLVEAQVRNLGVQDDMIKQIITNTNDMALSMRHDPEKLTNRLALLHGQFTG